MLEVFFQPGDAGRERKQDPTRAVAFARPEQVRVGQHQRRDNARAALQDETAPGFVGLCVSSAQLSDLDTLAPRLESLLALGGFLFVHPGAAIAPAGAPPWWTAIVDYTAQMHAAYVGWLVAGAPRWPELDVVFGILAGGAPIHLERMASRGVDERRSMLPHLWFDTATYGRRALDLAMSTYGVERLLFGSDIPVVDIDRAVDSVRSFGDAVANAVTSANPDRLLRR